MRFALSLASVLLLGSAAFAEDAAPSTAPAPDAAPAAAPAPAAPAPAAKKVTLRVVRVLEDTQQALMFDKAKGTHVLVELGKQINGFTVTDIDEDSVTLTAEGGQQIVLAGPDPSWRGNGLHRLQREAKAAPVKAAASAAPEDPYAAAAPMDPYGVDGEEGVRTVEAPATSAPSATAAPITAGEGGVRTAEAPGAPAAAGTAAKVEVTAAIPASTIPMTVAPTPTSPSRTMSTTTATATPTAAPIVSAAPVAAPVAAPSAEPAGPIDNSSSAAWSTTPTAVATPAAPVDPETAAILGLLNDTSSAPATSTAKPSAKKATKAAKAKDQAKDQKIASVSAAGTPAGAAMPATAAPATAAAAPDGATIIAKADVTAALGNFSALANAVRGSFSAGGAHLDAVAPDSLFAKAGLQAGDTITSINHQPLRSLDDAATLYSRAGSMRSATIQVLRAGKPLSLHLAIQ